ncbi:protein of unknown function [Geodermatophilus nigrescens]|uniref:DUF4253 domain-containing protein n=1 Tax=Geodermatophilus nigrescens TaxID=1070870 RepID=A0A1M5JRH0_9ACTN|nr:protein of unknown function [Geodermatophilus nigrescens]
MRRGLPLPGRLRIGDLDLDLGNGRPASARGLGSEDGPAPSAPLWLTDREIDAPMATWRRLFDLSPETGLWPLVLTPLGTEGCERPWDSGELEPAPVAAIDGIDPGAVLAEGWADGLVPIGAQPYVGHLRPFGREFPGLSAAGLHGGRPASVQTDALARGGRARIGLVPCARPADAVATIGWQGAINRRSAVELSAVLRSWEDRHGIVLAGLGFATVTLLVPHPPADEAEAHALAAELAALCPDVLAEDGPVDGFGLAGDGTLAGLARLLVGRPVWKLWWD